VKLATFKLSNGGGQAGPLAGVITGESVRAFAHGLDAVRDVLAGTLGTETDLGEYALADVELLAPISTPGTIFAAGRNYADHVAEMGGEPPTHLTLFVKVNSSVTAPSGPVICPAATSQLDYEGELAMVIGADGQVGGYCVADDISARDLQQLEPQWIRAKGADTFCPYGPWITTADEIADPEALGIRTWVNGELRQDSNTSNLIFGCEFLLDFISQTCTLRPGDLNLTGTPGGVGQGMKPPSYLRSGDVIKIEIEQLGSIEHSVS
jgi:acylpyruvate hydrolase